MHHAAAASSLRRRDPCMPPGLPLLPPHSTHTTPPSPHTDHHPHPPAAPTIYCRLSLQTKESKSFWKAMMKVHEKLTDINQIKAYNVIKETKLKVGDSCVLGD